MPAKPNITPEEDSIPEETCVPEEEFDPPLTKSEISQELIKLKNSVMKVVEERESLPQPLFWSLFNSKIKQMRERKESTRKVEELLSKLD